MVKAKPHIVTSFIKSAARKLLPPILHRQLRRSFKSAKASKELQAALLPPVDRLDAYYSNRNIPFHLNVTEMRYLGGMAFCEQQHHFVRYLKYGQSALIAYYRHHQPQDIFEQHFINSAPSNFKAIALPWDYSTKSYNGEGLPPEHGRQHYGPVSKKKLTHEMSRLDNLLFSIQEKGYDPSLGGHIRGYFLRNNNKNDEWRFLVVGGQHRAAVLAYLRYKEIPVIFQPNYVRVICEDEINEWPGVRSGQYSASDAKRVFQSYFRSSSCNLW